MKMSWDTYLIVCRAPSSPEKYSELYVTSCIPQVDRRPLERYQTMLSYSWRKPPSISRREILIQISPPCPINTGERSGHSISWNSHECSLNQFSISKIQRACVLSCWNFLLSRKQIHSSSPHSFLILLAPIVKSYSNSHCLYIWMTISTVYNWNWQRHSAVMTP